MTFSVEQTSSSRQDCIPPLSFLWLELTGRCNLKCTHCYADSGPSGPPDIVGTQRWLSLLNEAATLGVETVQFIGGEPTLHPDFRHLILSARQLGIKVEVYTNLIHIRKDLWQFFQDEQVALATSFYSHDEVSHDIITRSRGSQKRTRENIEIAVKLGLPLRVGITDVREDQDISKTIDYLHGLGVSDVRVDRTREVGRANPQQSSDPSIDQLCGRCANASLAIDPSGWAYPCIFARWLSVGNVRDSSLEQISRSSLLTKVREDLKASFRMRAKRKKYVT